MKTGAVVVLYHPREFDVENLMLCLKQQVDTLCLVDNSPKPLKRELSERSSNYLHFSDNIGVAQAQNVGLQYLIEMNCDYGLLLDQDSLPSSGMVEELSKVLKSHSKESENEVIAVGPTIFCDFTNKRVESIIQKPLKVMNDVQFVRQIISSGMLIKLSCLPQVGFKDATLFIDGVDHEWCWRAQKQGFSIGLAFNAQMVHRLGDGRKSIFGFKFKIGAPIRLYYQFRNILVLLRCDYVPFYWKLRNIFALPVRFVVNGVFLEHRTKRIDFMLKGIVDGIKGRKGKINNHWEN